MHDATDVAAPDVFYSASSDDVLGDSSIAERGVIRAKHFAVNAAFPATNAAGAVCDRAR